ncbi:hypothetical protein MMC21_001089 [Puttea exsequens]|nr:hypothetical protein [Puttea exsequens]
MGPTTVPGPASLPIMKLSHCTSQNLQAKVTWTHLANRDDMYVVFDLLRTNVSDGSVKEHSVLKVVTAGELFDTIYLKQLQQQAFLDEDRSRSQRMTDNDLYVLILLKKPLLALRYRLPSGNTRRLQFNFNPPEGCDIAVNNFRSLGIPIRDKSDDRIRPQSAQAALGGSSKAQANSLAAPNSLPLARQLAHSRLDSSTQPGLSPSQVSSQCQLAGYMGGAYGSMVPPTQHRQQILGDGSQRNDLSATIASQPSSGTCGPGSLLRLSSVDHDFRQGLAVRSMSSLPAVNSQYPATLASSSSQMLLPSATFAGPSSGLMEYEKRPNSAPETQSTLFPPDSDSIHQMLPPKRILPFEKKLPARKKRGPCIDCRRANRDCTHREDTVDGEKPNSGDSERPLETIQQPKDASTVVVPKMKKAQKVGTKAKSQGAGMLLPAPGPKSSGPKTRSKEAPPASAKPEESPSSSAPPRFDLSRKRSKNRISPIDENSPATPPPSSPIKRPNKRRRVALKDRDPNEPGPESATRIPIAASSVEQPPQTALTVLSNIAPADFLDSLDSWVRKFQNLPAPAPQPQTAKEQLAEYAKQSDEDRARAIDNAICECLEDENFIKLVEDVERCWKRIAIGF